MISSDRLSQIDLFEGLSERQRSAIAEVADDIDHSAGETVFREGSEAEFLYVLLEGEIALQIGLTSKPQTVTVSLIKQAHQTLGWSGVVAPHHYTANAVAKTNCRLLAIPGTQFLEILRSEPDAGFEVLLRIAQVISSRLRNSRAALLRTL